MGYRHVEECFKRVCVVVSVHEIRISVFQGKRIAKIFYDFLIACSEHNEFIDSKETLLLALKEEEVFQHENYEFWCVQISLKTFIIAVFITLVFSEILLFAYCSCSPHVRV